MSAAAIESSRPEHDGRHGAEILQQFTLLERSLLASLLRKKLEGAVHGPRAARGAVAFCRAVRETHAVCLLRDANRTGDKMLLMALAVAVPVSVSMVARAPVLSTAVAAAVRVRSGSN